MKVVIGVWIWGAYSAESWGVYIEMSLLCSTLWIPKFTKDTVSKEFSSWGTAPGAQLPSDSAGPSQPLVREPPGQAQCQQASGCFSFVWWQTWEGVWADKGCSARGFCKRTPEVHVDGSWGTGCLHSADATCQRLPTPTAPENHLRCSPVMVLPTPGPASRRTGATGLGGGPAAIVFLFLFLVFVFCVFFYLPR